MSRVRRPVMAKKNEGALIEVGRETQAHREMRSAICVLS
jgi:hypothetical protein